MKMGFTNYLKDPRILVLVAIIIGFAALDLVYGIHFGIEFSGGTQIPVNLEYSVNASTMSTMVSELNQRVSTFGLKEVTVEGVGNNQIYVTIPTVSQNEINQTVNIINSQGRFLGIVNGIQALNGSGILKGSVGSLPPQQSNNEVSWAVSFFITDQATSQFAKAVFGQANQPIYMFLDRPNSTIIIVNESILGNNTLSVSEPSALSAMQKALVYGQNSIPVIAVTNANYSIANAENFVSAHRKQYSTALVSYNLNKSLIRSLEGMGIKVQNESNANMTPTYVQLGVNNTIIDSWGVVGLLSAPILNASLTNGTAGDNYEISGLAPLSMSSQDQYNFATNQEKTIMSILNGGALPVPVIVGTPTTIPPTLGKEALYVSLMAGLLSLLAITVFITIRYKKVFLVVPILLTTFAELFIILSIIGLVGTIDLSAVAGMIGVVGTGVDAQIIITDEILSKENEQGTAKGILNKAFYIIWADSILLILAMLPLFFSTSLVQVIGFSEATIIGALLGVLVTRPAYGALLNRHFK